MLIKCPECGKEISDIAEVCPSCGYPIASKKENYVPIAEENAEHTQQEQDSVPIDIEDINGEESGEKKTGKKKIIIAAALVACGCIAAVVLTNKKPDNIVHITSDDWSYFETPDGKEYTGTLKTDSKKDLAVFTKTGDCFVLKSGEETSVKENTYVNQENQQKGIDSIYEIKTLDNTNIKLDVGELKNDISDSIMDMKSAKLKVPITSDSEKPFLLFYHFEDADGNKQETLLSSTMPYEMITENETTITDSIWHIKKDSNTDFQFVIDGIIEFQMDDNAEMKLGEFSESMETLYDGGDSYYKASQPVSVSSGESGIAWATVTVDGKDEGLNYCRVTDGNGTLNWNDRDVTSVSDAPEIEFEMKYFSPSEYTTDFVIDSKDAEKKIPTLKEVADRYGSDYFDTVVLVDDESCLMVDTNPFDTEDMGFSSVWDDIVGINKMLGLPDSLNEKMKTTRSMDGRQSESFDNVDVSWTYHPDNGLEVMYEAKN